MPGITLTVAAFLAIFLNTAFWKAVIGAAEIGMARHLGFGLSLAAAMLAFFVLLVSLFGVRYLFKPAVVVLLFVASLASYFMNVYGVVIDDTMIHNVLETDSGEASGLFSMQLLVHLLLTAILPALVVCLWRIRYRPFWRELGLRTLTVTLAIGVLGVSVYSHYKDFSLVLREHRELRYLVNPTYPLYAAVDTLMQTAEAANAPVVPLGRDAHQQRPVGAPRRVVVLVVGETARAANFSLDGYTRDTNPRLAHRDIVNFPDFTACGTSTSVSVPCMFSRQGRRDYDEYEARHTEGLLDVLDHAGVSVLWRDNNSGCKGTCARVPTEDLSNADAPALCDDGACRDEILLRGLQRHIEAGTRDLFIVLHQQGSHGPEYYKRYPARFERFTPVCASNLPQECDRQAIVNAYDNTILYTDYVLDEIIDLLERNARTNHDTTALLYLSDHGESLGEHGLYLHGFPYALAPDVQTHVPALAWFSRGFGMGRGCLARIAGHAYSQDNLFDLVLGLFRVQTSVYRRINDIFYACRYTNGARHASRN
ncbi:phosphoethanolamine transferase [Salinisphaera orenii]|uniref:phosphoethanolamine transferase n=1 Tax=Salinisphaera orenii TaxID=856731 RepID=UPI000F47B302|nr:phosphoethanolamine--lipid A transferase [Salinisphaera halophila]